MHLGAAELLVVGVLAGRHLHERRAGEVDLRLLLDHDDVVAHAGDVRAAGGRAAEHEADRRDASLRAPREIAEAAATRDEDLRLVRQVGARRTRSARSTAAGLLGDLRRPGTSCAATTADRAALHRRVVRDDHALDALDHADAADDAGADREVAAPAGERHQLEEVRALVEEQLDPLARGELAALLVTVVYLPPASTALVCSAWSDSIFSSIAARRVVQR